MPALPAAGASGSKGTLGLLPAFLKSSIFPSRAYCALELLNVEFWFELPLNR